MQAWHDGRKSQEVGRQWIGIGRDGACGIRQTTCMHKIYRKEVSLSFPPTRIFNVEASWRMFVAQFICYSIPFDFHSSCKQRHNRFKTLPFYQLSAQEDLTRKMGKMSICAEGDSIHQQYYFTLRPHTTPAHLHDYIYFWHDAHPITANHIKL